ncbi:hypothetical protein [Brevibacterium sp.]|uniref:hypothetical protein n=1 Tax=Brevibacterium sp. TaxID=1701 RepID=UPI0028122650|nr:hypothetical protein [Brevibacterium sp.]
MHILSPRTVPAVDVVAEILALHDEHLRPGQDIEVRIVFAEVLGGVDVVAVAVDWGSWGATIVQTYSEDEDGVAEAHQYVIGRPLTGAKVQLAVDVVLADLWPRLVDSMDF